MKRSRLGYFKTGLKTFDTRKVKPPEKKADPELLTQAHGQWAVEVKRKAGWQCEWVKNGRRCQVRHPEALYADHIIEREDDPSKALDPDNGRCLCSSHHGLKTKAAARERGNKQY